MEGPSLVILKEELQPFIGKEILEVSGNSKIDQQRLSGLILLDVKTWGKHLLLCFDEFTLKVHFLLFGNYRINVRRDIPARLTFNFENGEFNMYNCSIKFLEEPLSELYDRRVDVMSDIWDEKYVWKLVKDSPKTMIADILLDQNTFAGVGNIIKNEALFRLKIHPETLVEALSPKQRKALVKEGHDYSWDFYRWKKVYELRKHYKIYTKKFCPVCEGLLTKRKVGKTNRRTFFCEHCQELYT